MRQVDQTEHAPHVHSYSLLLAPCIPLEYFRAEALAGLAPHLPDSLKADALRAARAITHEESRARALTGLARHLPDRLQVEALAESFPFADRYMIEQIMSIMSNHSQAGFQVLLWREILHTLAQGTRRDLLESLTALVPLIEHLGGQAAIEDLFYALHDAAQWWP